MKLALISLRFICISFSLMCCCNWWIWETSSCNVDREFRSLSIFSHCSFASVCFWRNISILFQNGRKTEYILKKSHSHRFGGPNPYSFECRLTFSCSKFLEFSSVSHNHFPCEAVSPEYYSQLLDQQCLRRYYSICNRHHSRMTWMPTLPVNHFHIEMLSKCHKKNDNPNKLNSHANQTKSQLWV